MREIIIPSVDSSQARRLPHSVHTTTHFTRVRDATRLSSPFYISTHMLPLDEVVLWLNSQDVPDITAAARQFNVNRSTLSKKFKHQSGSRAQAAERKQFLSTKHTTLHVNISATTYGTTLPQAPFESPHPALQSDTLSACLQCVLVEILLPTLHSQL